MNSGAFLLKQRATKWYDYTAHAREIRSRWSFFTSVFCAACLLRFWVLFYYYNSGFLAILGQTFPTARLFRSSKAYAPMYVCNIYDGDYLAKLPDYFEKIYFRSSKS